MPVLKPQPPATVLVIDDVPDNLLVVSDLLREAGYHVLAANSGPVGLRYVRQARPDLILLDIMMPDMDGFEVLAAPARERRDARHPGDLPHRAAATMRTSEHGLAVGAVDYLTKPLRPAGAGPRAHAPRS